MSGHSRTTTGLWKHVHYSTTCTRYQMNPDYNTPEYAVYWCYWTDKDERPTFDDGGEMLTDELGVPIMETFLLEAPKYTEQRLAGFPTLAEASRHAATVREMRYA